MHADNTTMGFGTLERGFLSLSIIGFCLLWPMMGYNGTLLALLRAAWLGVFGDGRTFRTSYTGFFPIDFAISILVAFFEDQINGSDEGAWLLMFDLVMTLQAATVWVLVEAYRQNQTTKMSRTYLLLPFLWNVFGAAIFLPLFFILQARDTKYAAARPPVPSNIGKALVPITTLIVLTPAFGMLFAHRSVDSSTRQSLIAFYQFTPLFLPVAITLSTTRFGHGFTSDNSENRRRLVRFAYAYVALLSTASHIYTLIATLSCSLGATTFAKVFRPSLSNTMPGSSTNIHDGAALFLQFDWIVVNCSCALWMFSFIHASSPPSTSVQRLKMIVLILVMCFLLGPGGAASAVFWLRESRR